MMNKMMNKNGEENHEWQWSMKKIMNQNDKKITNENDKEND